MAAPHRGTFLTICAICFGLLAVSNFLKPLHLTDNAGFVFFGTRLQGAGNAIVAPLFGAFLAVYAFGIWTMRRYVLGMSHAYAVYVIINLVLWQINTSETDPLRVAGGVVYAAVAVGISLGAALALTRRKAELR
jgi:hypothetical protein